MRYTLLVTVDHGYNLDPDGSGVKHFGPGDVFIVEKNEHWDKEIDKGFLKVVEFETKVEHDLQDVYEDELED
jgi:hypothetical protein